MGLILDSSILIADERNRLDTVEFLRQIGEAEPVITAITASELLHGLERADNPVNRARREQHLRDIFSSLTVVPFDLAQARHHARIWADLERRGQMIGPYDLLIAAAGLATGYAVATLNVGEFNRVPGLSVIDAAPFRIER